MRALVDVYKNYELMIDIFLGIVTSSSIAAWAIWDKFPIIWGSLIALSHVVLIIKPNFPFSKFRTEILKKITLSQDVALEYEKVFFDISNSNHSEEYIAKEYFKLRNKKNKLFTFSKEIILAERKSILNRVNNEMKEFLKNEYNID